MNQQLISAIRIENLFGLYTYRLPKEGALSNAAILYGENGVGKSTILRLAFHLLSAAGNKGHRTALYNTEFQSLEVDLTSGVTLSARQVEGAPSKVLTLSISKVGETLALWEHIPGPPLTREQFESEEYSVEVGPDGIRRVQRQSQQSKRAKESSIPRGEKAYLTILAELAPTLFILNADRRLDSDSVADPSDEMEIRRVMRYEEPKRIKDLVVRSREIALSQALSVAGRWISRRAFNSANQGSMNVHTVYGSVLRNIVTVNKPQIVTNSSDNSRNLTERLTAIETRTAEYARYELTTPLSTAEFKKALNTRSKSRKTLICSLLEPYLTSLESRFEALDPIYRIVDRFITIVNGFLSDKSIGFKPSQGFSIQNRLKTSLEPAQLSSGEQQLLLLFCYVLIGRDKPSVFLIDEPEISLNIRWQRQLIQSLLDITSGEKIQFIFASHSMELLTQHRSRVVKLMSTQ